MTDAASAIASMIQSIDVDTDSKAVWAQFSNWVEQYNNPIWGYFLLPPFEEQLNNRANEGEKSWVDCSPPTLIGPLKNLSYGSFSSLKSTLRYVEKTVLVSDFHYQVQLISDLQKSGYEIDPKETYLVPVFGPRALNGCFVITCPQIDTNDNLLPIICQMTHTAHVSHLIGPAEEKTNLTVRECEILRALSHGLSSSQIADSLSISPYTVNGYLQRIFLKIGVQDRTTAVLFGFASGIIK